MGCETSCANAPKNTLNIRGHVSVISVMVSPINSNHSQVDCFVQKHVQTNTIILSRRWSFVWCSYYRGYYLVIISASNAESNSITSSWRVAGAWPAARRVSGGAGKLAWPGGASVSLVTREDGGASGVRLVAPAGILDGWGDCGQGCRG